MDALPVAFYRDLAILWKPETIQISCGIPGILGAIVTETLEREVYLHQEVSNGRLTCNEFLIANTGEEAPNWEESSSRSPYYHNLTTLYVDAEDAVQYSTDPDALRALLKANNGRSVSLHFITTNLCKAIETFVESITVIYGLKLYTPTSDSVKRILKTLLEKKTLIYVNLADNPLDQETTELITDLLKQEQLDFIDAPRLSYSSLKQVIAEWKKNSAQMTGKRLFGNWINCKNLTKQEFVKELGFEQITEEDQRRLCVYWPQATYAWLKGDANLFVSKTEQVGGTIYWFFERTKTGKLMALFD